MTGRLSGELMDAANNRGTRRQEARRHPQDGRRQPRLLALSLVTRTFQPWPRKTPLKDVSQHRHLPRISMPARRRRPSAFSITPARAIRSAKCMKAPPPWTGWSRSRSAASPSPRPPRPASGKTTASTSSTRPATWISPSKWSVPCACWTALSPCSTPSPASSRRSETVWRQADKYHVPRICFVNKMDRTGADFPALRRHDDRPPGHPPDGHHLPIGAEGEFKGIIDIVKMKALVWHDEAAGRQVRRRSKFPPNMPTRPRNCAPQLIEIAVEDGRCRDGSISRAARSRREAISKRCIRKGTIACPFRAGDVRLGFQEQGRAAAAGRGGRLSAVARSTFRRSRASRSSTDEEVERPADDKAPFAGLAFKIMNDPFVGSLTFVRVYSGTIKSGTCVLNTVKDKTRARRPHAADACQYPRRNQGSLCRRHRRFGRPQGHHHRRNAVRSATIR